MKPLRISLLQVAIVMMAACHNNPPAKPDHLHRDTTSITQVDTNTSRGAELFNDKCRVCHGPAGDPKQVFAANLQRTVMDSLSIAYTIKNGRHNMPGFLTMPDSDVAQLALYVKSLRLAYDRK